MVAPFIETPRTELGNRTYLDNPNFDSDFSQELSFNSPTKAKDNLLEQLKAGRRGAALRTPGARTAVASGRVEFTPLLKSATRNNALRGTSNGNSNVFAARTPAFARRGGGLDQINEASPLPQDFRNSTYSSGDNTSRINGTPAPVVEEESTAGLDTPMNIPARRGGKDGVLQDGNQLSLREQENVIDRVEKENFGLKLKIHFLEDALRKAGPGFSEAALKENTDLKVDKVTMQKEMKNCKRQLNDAEKDLEDYRKQMVLMQEKARSKNLNEDTRQEVKILQSSLEEKEREINQLKKKLDNADTELAETDKLRDQIEDLEAELQEKDRLADEHDDKMDELKAQLKEKEEKIQAQADDDETNEKIEELQQEIKRLKSEVEDADQDRHDAMTERESALNEKRQADEEIQRVKKELSEARDEIANKSQMSRGLNRQLEDKSERLAEELEELQDTHKDLQTQYDGKARAVDALMKRVQSLQESGNGVESSRRKELANATEQREKLEMALKASEDELDMKTASYNLLSSRHDALTAESAGLQNEIKKSEDKIEDLEDKLDHEKTLALNSEREIRDQYKTELNRLHDDIEDLNAKILEKERLYSSDKDQWSTERRKLESQCDIAEKRATGLQRTLDQRDEIETTIHGKEFKMQAALDEEKERHAREQDLLVDQIEKLHDEVEEKQKVVDDLRSEMTNIKESLRLSQRDQKASSDQVEALEDEIEVLQTNLDDESEKAQLDIDAAKKESQTLRDEIRALKLDLETVTDSRTRPENSTPFKTKMASQLRDIESQLEKARTEKQEIHDKHTELTIELATLKARVVDLEMERDEYKSQLEDAQQSSGDTTQINQERLELRTSKVRLEAEVRRARDEEKLLAEQLETIEQEFEQEVERASKEEAKMHAQILALQKQSTSTGPSNDREAKRTITRLEQQIASLESQLTARTIPSSPLNSDVDMLKSDLDRLRQKETEYLNREKAHKESIQALKRQIADFERRSHDMEVSRLASDSPTPSSSASARKTEITELKSQLSAAQTALRDFKTSHKEAERENVREIASLNLKLRTQSSAFENEKEKLETELDDAMFNKETLESQIAELESTSSRLRGKVSHLEKELSSSRRNKNHDTTMANERSELHEMLRETQIRADQLEMELTTYKNQINAVSSKERELRTQLKRVREERSTQRDLAQEAVKEMTALETDYEVEKARWNQEKSTQKDKMSEVVAALKILKKEYSSAIKSWDSEKARLVQRTQEDNQSHKVSRISSGTHKHESQSSVLHNLVNMGQEVVEADKKHIKELQGLTMQIQWLQALLKREANLRVDAAFAKRYLNLRIEGYEAWYVRLTQFLLYDTNNFQATRQTWISCADMAMRHVQHSPNLIISQQWLMAPRNLHSSSSRSWYKQQCVCNVMVEHGPES